LSLAQDLADEDASDRKGTSDQNSAFPDAAFGFDSRFAGDNEEEYQGQYEDGDDDEWGPEEEEEIVEDDMDPEDMAVFNKFLPAGQEMADFAPSLASLSTRDRKPEPDSTLAEDGGELEGPPTNLTDLILQRIAEKEAFDAAHGASGVQRPLTPPADNVEIPPRVVETFIKVGHLLSRYKSGPLPKPFKVLPTLPQWNELLAITQPEDWTPHAVHRATKIFISAPAATGQYFVSTVLLDRVRQDISESDNKKLNVHLYNALKTAFYRPSAFFKGFLFPLVEASCTLREAHIISSVLAKIKIPVLHSAAALLRLCEICAEQTTNINSEAAGAANIFIRVLLGKKYALPYKVVDALVFHFLRFRASKDANGEDGAGLGSKEAKLPVLWHQSLLIFAQTYRNEITEDQREALLDLLLARGHKDIGPEVRRELLAGRNRGGQPATDGHMALDVEEKRDDGDDTMIM
jgi:essential nuclear protein 1